GVGRAAPVVRQQEAPKSENRLVAVDARIAELSKTWANARTPEQKSELAALKAEKAKLSPPVDGPLLNPVQPKSGPVPRSVIDKAQSQLDAGDRGGAYLTLYKELGNEQLLVQAQITT